MTEPLIAERLPPSVSRESLLLAVERGVLTHVQLERLVDIEQVLRPSATAVDDENLRFISGFGDIFVTIGIALFLGSLFYFQNIYVSAISAWAGSAVTSWLLAEMFTRRRRMALPSIVLLIGFAVSFFRAVLMSYLSLIAAQDDFRSFGRVFGSSDPTGLVIASLLTVGATAVHYRRFRVPITVAAGTAALGLACLAGLALAFPTIMRSNLSWFTLALGLTIFALAMRFDLSDPMRRTRRADIAFWLHLLAAPLIVHSLIGGLFRQWGLTDLAWPILGVFAFLGLIALLVDRRAILVAGLSYAGYALVSLVGASGLTQGILPLVLLILGAVVLMLSAGWSWLRSMLLDLVGPSLAGRLPGSHLRDNRNRVPAEIS